MPLGSTIERPMARHLEDNRRRTSAAVRFAGRLADMSTALGEFDCPSTEELFATIEEMTMLESAVHGTTALLVYDDLPAAHDYLVRVYGLTAGPLQQDDQGRCVHAEVRAGDHVIWLHPSASEYQSPRRLGAVTGMTPSRSMMPTRTIGIAWRTASR